MHSNKILFILYQDTRKKKHTKKKGNGILQGIFPTATCQSQDALAPASDRRLCVGPSFAWHCKEAGPTTSTLIGLVLVWNPLGPSPDHYRRQTLAHIAQSTKCVQQLRGPNLIRLTRPETKEKRRKSQPLNQARISFGSGLGRPHLG